MCRMRKRVVCLLLCCLLALSPVGFCSAATYQVTEQELATLESNLKRLQTINEMLTTNSSQSQIDLIKVSELLNQSQSELATLREQLQSSQSEVKLTRLDLQKANESLAQASKSFKAYEREQQSAQNSLKAQRTLWQIITGIAVGAAVYSAARK